VAESVNAQDGVESTLARSLPGGDAGVEASGLIGAERSEAFASGANRMARQTRRDDTSSSLHGSSGTLEALNKASRALNSPQTVA
jgi:hypothetical protein